MYSISIIIPTLNSGRVLSSCLQSIFAQSYPSHLISVYIVDGGSTDNTRSVAASFGAIVIDNPLRTAEAAKALAIRHCPTELIALIDSDNILPDSNWLHKMVQPFSHPDIQATEPMYMTYRPSDGYITRYCALMGMVDPVCYYVGNYDRWNHIDNAWTRLNVPTAHYNTYSIAILKANTTSPTIGANGTLIRTAFAKRALHDSVYYFDVDIFHPSSAFTPIVIAKVQASIVHIYCTTLSDVWRKQYRRINDYYFFTAQGVRTRYLENDNWPHYIRFCIDAFLFFPILSHVFRGLKENPDLAWFAHIPMCYITLYIYVTTTIKCKWLGMSASVSRERWKQTG